MKLPNGYGSVYKLSGNRRKPWAVSKTMFVDGKKKQVIIDYCETQEEGLNILAYINANPIDISKRKLTFSDVYNSWSKEHFENVSQSNVNGYQASYKTCYPLYDKPFTEIRLDDLQNVVDNSKKNYPTLRKLKVLLNMMYKYAMQHDIANKDYSTYVNIIKFKDVNPNKVVRDIFSEEDLKILWKNKNDDCVSIILILIYTGLRVSELLDLKKDDVFLENQYFKVITSKTQAGIRAVPIHNELLPIFEYWYNKDCKYLLCTQDNKHFTYRNYYDSSLKVS